MTKATENILISLKPRHADNVIRGRKTVELRRRRVRIKEGSRLWIYATLPRGTVDCVAIVANVVSGSPKSIWRRYWRQTCIDRDEFYRYVDGEPSITAIVLGTVYPLRQSLSLEELREKLISFHPPQFIQRIDATSRLWRLLVNATGRQEVTTPG